MINLPNNIISDIGSTTSSFVNDFSQPAILIIGILIALYIIDSIISMLSIKNNIKNE